MKKLLILFFFAFLSISSFCQNNIGFQLYMPISNLSPNSENTLDYQGNTQLKMNMELFYEREREKRLHHLGISYQDNAFKYLDSNIQKFSYEEFTTINYTYYHKHKVGDFTIFHGSGAIVSFLNSQKNYRLNTTNIVNENSFGDLIKMSLFVETRILIPGLLSTDNKKHDNFKQCINFRLGADLGSLKNNNAIFHPLIFVSGGYTVYYSF